MAKSRSNGDRRRLIIKDATVITMDPDIPDRLRASILIENGKIAAIESQLDATDAELIDATGLIALPGFVDAHRHLWQGALTLLAADADLNTYFTDILARIAPSLTPEDAYISNLAGALQAIEAGVTTLYDWSHVQNTPQHSDALVKGLLDSGIRAIFAYAYPGLGPEWYFESKKTVPDDIRRVRRELLPSADGLVTMAMGLRGPEMSDISVTKSDLALARDLGLKPSVHVGNGDFGVPYKAIERLREHKLLGPDILYVHGNSLPDESIKLIAGSGGSIVATPTIEMQMQFGWPATTRFLAAGVRPALGVDVATSTDVGMFAQMSCTFQAARLQAYKEKTTTVNTRDVLGFATIDGARAIGLDHLVGTLTPGKQADIVVLRPSALQQINDPIGFAVLSAGTQTVDTVIVAGTIRKRDGEMIEIDSGKIAHELALARDRIIKRSGVSAPASHLS